MAGTDPQPDALGQADQFAPDLPAGYLEAGQNYCIALSRLGFDFQLAIWARDATLTEWVLLLSTTLLEAVGPMKIMNALFTAYDRKATPAEISPFIIRLQSPDHSQMRSLIDVLDHGNGIQLIGMMDDGREYVMPPSPELEKENGYVVGDLAVRAGWRYVVGRQGKRPVNPFKSFKSFERQVESLAA